MHSATWIALNVNGQMRQVHAEGATPLLDVLRNGLGLRAAHFGCGQGQCGSCQVLVDGRPTAACNLSVEAAAGGAIATLEGLAGSPELLALQQAFEAGQAAQCGYCLSGILVGAVALLRRNPRPTRAQVCQALDGHLCRCGAHNRMLQGVERAAQSLPERAPAG